jgi:hypothetical protein
LETTWKYDGVGYGIALEVVFWDEHIDTHLNRYKPFISGDPGRKSRYETCSRWFYQRTVLKSAVPYRTKLVTGTVAEVHHTLKVDTALDGYKRCKFPICIIYCET